jgi:TonB-linked SusC/RagA family outer membrane protein
MKLSLPTLALYKFALLMCLASTITSAQVTASLARMQTREPESNRVVVRQLKDALQDLEKRFQVYFTFESAIVKGLTVRSSQTGPASVEAALNEWLPPLNLGFEKISNNYYSIFLKNAAIDTKKNIPQSDSKPDSVEIQLQEQTQDEVVSFTTTSRAVVTGLVTEENGSPIPGVNIIERGTTNGTISDVAGKYSINTTTENPTLTFSFVGYISAEELVGGRTEINVSLASDVKTLSEVVVVGYGTQEKKSITAAISTVNKEDLANRPVVNVSQALQGLAPNLTIQQNSAEPGSVQTINIRGVGSFTNNSPLILVDGINVGQLGLNNLNPNDIENISVLKDAASAAIFGSQAGNGVIFITTKTGKKSDKVSVQYSGMFGLQTPTTSPKPVEGWEFMTLKNEALANSGLPPQFTPTQIAAQREAGSYDWAYDKMVNNTVPQQNQNISVSGGNAATTYLLSVGYMNQQSLYNGDFIPDDQKFYYKRLNLRSNISTQISKYVRVDLNLGYTNSANRTHSYIGGTGILVRDAMRQPRIYPLVDEAGNFAVAPLTSNSVFALLSQGGYKLTQSDNMLGMANLNIKPITGLSIDINTSVNYSIYNDQTQVRAFTYAPAYTTVAPPQRNEQALASWRDLVTSTFATATYEKTFNKHGAKIMAGFRNDYFSDYNFIGARRFNGIVLDNQYMSGGGFNTNTDGDIQGNFNSYVDIRNPGLKTINSFFGRLNYSYTDKYLVEFTWRYDGASILAPGNRWFFFPAASFGWRLTNEEFMSGIQDKIGDIKLRYSIGQLGNSNIGGYEFLPRVAYTQGAYSFNNTSVQGVTFSPVNTELEWERTTMSNFGVDYTTPSGAITASFDYFNRNTEGIYFRPNVPGSLGLSAPLQNYAEVKSVGWEFTVSARANTGGVSHQISANIADNTNKIVRLGPEQILGFDFNYINKEGFPIGSYFLYKSDGLYQTLDDLNSAPQVPFANNQTVNPGDIRYVDKDENGVINGDDRYISGNPFPRYTFGVTYSAQWKTFDFQMFWQGVGQRSQYLRGDIVEAFHNNEEHAFVQHLDRWTPTNPDASYPRLTAGSALNLNNVAFSDYWLFDTRYLRLKNIQLGYSLPKDIISKVRLENLRVYVSAQNLLTILPERFGALGVDPEFTQFDNALNFTSYNQIAGRNYPNAKTVSLGIDIKF